MRKTSNAYSARAGNLYLDALSELKDDLAGIVANVGGDTHGIAVDHPQLKTARLRASKVADPILSSPLPSPSQVCTLTPELGHFACIE